MLHLVYESHHVRGLHVKTIIGKGILDDITGEAGHGLPVIGVRERIAAKVGIECLYRWQCIAVRVLESLQETRVESDWLQPVMAGVQS